MGILVVNLQKLFFNNKINWLLEVKLCQPEILQQAAAKLV